MTTFLALLTLLLCSAANTVAFFWFLYGEWPQAWWPIPLFSMSSAVIYSALSQVAKESKS